MAQSAPLYIVAVDFDVDLRHRQEFLGAILEDGAAAVREPGGREFHVASSEQNLTHVFVFAAYDNAAAWDSHQKTVHYGNFIKTTSAAVKTYDFRPFSSVAMNTKGTTLSGHFFINVAYLDIDQADFDKFMDAARENATASVKDPGCQEFNIAVSQQHP